MTRKLIFTVDLDRDVNFPMEGSVAAGSIDRGEGTSPRFSSADRGLDVLLDVLDDVGMKATFFVEGRTSEVLDLSRISGHCIGFHGYDHEDLTGASTGVVFDDDGLKGILRRGFDAVSDSVSKPVCFRAPYMSCDDRVLRAVSELGIMHDSSVYSTVGVQPYPVSFGITEHPVPKGKDVNGKTIAAYLWPMHEGKRQPEDYIRMASEVEDGDHMIATHTWHMVERREGGPLDDREISLNASRVHDVLSGILDLGFRPETLVR